jgi:valyl-tRNA synthetase
MISVHGFSDQTSISAAYWQRNFCESDRNAWKQLKLYPFMPFLTEEIWQMQLQRRSTYRFNLARMKPLTRLWWFWKHNGSNFWVRTIRKDKNIPFKDAIELKQSTMIMSTYFDSEGVTCKLDAVSDHVSDEIAISIYSSKIHK